MFHVANFRFEGVYTKPQWALNFFAIRKSGSRITSLVHLKNYTCWLLSREGTINAVEKVTKFILSWVIDIPLEYLTLCVRKPAIRIDLACSWPVKNSYLEIARG